VIEIPLDSPRLPISHLVHCDCGFSPSQPDGLRAGVFFFPGVGISSGD
jgi:hypothetical protein